MNPGERKLYIRKDVNHELLGRYIDPISIELIMHPYIIHSFCTISAARENRMNGKRFHPRGMIKNRKRERDINYRVRFITFSSSPRNKAETQESNDS